MIPRPRAHSGIRLRSTSESGPVGASRRLSQAQNQVLSVFGLSSVSRLGGALNVARFCFSLVCRPQAQYPLAREAP